MKAASRPQTRHTADSLVCGPSMCVCGDVKKYIKKNKKSLRHSADSFVLCVCGDVTKKIFTKKRGVAWSWRGRHTQKPRAQSIALCACGVYVCVRARERAPARGSASVIVTWGEARVGRGKCMMHVRERGVRGGRGQQRPLKRSSTPIKTVRGC